MRKILAKCVWAASAAYYVFNGGEDCMASCLMLLVGIVIGFLVLALPDGYSGMNGSSD